MFNGDSIVSGDGCGTLVLLLHAYTHRATDLASVEQAVLDVWPEAKVHRPELDACLFSMADPNRIVAGLVADVDKIVADAELERQPFDNIVLIGHSLGALLARKLYIVACGEVPQAPLEPVFREVATFANVSPNSPRPWASKVSRIILLAGMNRGWRVSHHVSLKHAPLWWLGSGYCHVAHMITNHWPLIFTIRRGAEFITQLRIQWLLMRRRASLSVRLLCPGDALTVQLLGSQDDMVAPEDNVDLVSGGDFIYLDVPYSGHSDVIQMNDPAHGPGRKELFLQSLRLSVEELRRKAVVPSDEGFISPNLLVLKMVFVIHGIRDVGYWTHKIARRIRERAADKSPEWATETSSYGYFPMLPFLLPWPRRQKVEWLMDQYTEALARYPKAAFSFVGHSNGTYLLAKALELYPCCRFENIVFAGSVVRCDYEWQRFLQATPPRVNAVLNFVASSDWVVAFFPKVFQLLRWQDLGSAGHDGFAIAEQTPGLYEARYVKGGHGAAIEEHVWNIIADFVVAGHTDVNQLPGRNPSRARWVELLGRFPLIVWLLILGVVCLIGWGAKSLIGAVIDDASLRAFLTGFAAAAYLLIIWLLATRL